MPIKTKCKTETMSWEGAYRVRTKSEHKKAWKERMGPSEVNREYGLITPRDYRNKSWENRTTNSHSKKMTMWGIE